MMLINFFGFVDKIGKFINIRIYIEKHSGLNDPERLSENSCYDSSLKTCPWNSTHDFEMLINKCLLSVLVSLF
jgi:hypothetical protein